MAVKNEMLTNQFFDVCRSYFEKPEKSYRAAAAQMGIQHPTFMRQVKSAFKAGYLVLKGPHDEEASHELNRVLSGLAPGGRHIETYVVKETDDDSFACSAAEHVLSLLKEFLVGENKKEVNLGVVSGTTTTKTITQLVNGRFWEELMHGVSIGTKQINIMALNISPVFHGEELSYNAVNTVLMLHAWLKVKLTGRACEVIPYQLGSSSIDVKAKEEEFKSNRANQDVLKYADPGRLDGSDTPSMLDMVITSIGSSTESLLRTIIERQSLCVADEDKLAGDLLFYPLDTEGKEVKLTGKDGEDYLVYSALRLKTIRRMVEDGKAKIVLIARDRLRRTGKKKQETVLVDKHKAILAATKGGYYNELITDASTADKLM